MNSIHFGWLLFPFLLLFYNYLQPFDGCYTNQAVLPDLEHRYESLKKEKEEAESAWKLSSSSVSSTSPTINADDAAEVLSSGSVSEGIQGMSADKEVSSDPASDSSINSALGDAVSETVAKEPSKSQELLELEDAFKEADNAKRSHQR